MTSVPKNEQSGREPSKNQWKGGELRVQKKWKGKKWKSKKKKKKKKDRKKQVKYRRSSLWTKAEDRIASFLVATWKEDTEEKKDMKSRKRPRTWQVFAMSGRLFFFLMLVARSWLCVNAAAEGLQQRTEMMDGWQNLQVQVKESRWAKEIPQRWNQPKREDRTEMKKEAKRLRCTLLNGSAWSTERKYMRRCKGKCDIFFGMEDRLRKEEMEEQFNREAKERWRFAADAARITDERASGEDQKHSSGGVSVAVDSNLGAFVGAEEEAIKSIPGNEGRIVQVWVNVRGGMRIFSVYFWHSEGWTSRNEALLQPVL